MLNLLPGYTPLALATLLYCWQSVEYAAHNQHALSIVFIGYAVANMGLIWDFIYRVQS